ncbi:MAG: Hsp20/alpha crystallin family protein [Treponema sp.]|jgi:HSP20 family protein|nr:Hsp20/alpha crystallin family protein [Treponema sp.]
MMNALTLFDNFMNDGCSVTPDFNFTTSVPEVDVKEDKDAYTMKMDLPGRSEKDIQLELDHNVLTISSRHEEKKEEKSPDTDKSSWLIRERSSSEFSRSFTLPDDVKAEKVSADFKNGVLSVRIPREAPVEPRRIAIEAA